MAQQIETVAVITIFGEREMSVTDANRYNALRPAFAAGAAVQKAEAAFRAKQKKAFGVGSKTGTGKGEYVTLLGTHGIGYTEINGAIEAYASTYYDIAGIDVSSLTGKKVTPSKNSDVRLVVMLMAEATSITPDKMALSKTSAERKAATDRAKQALRRMLPKKGSLKGAQTTPGTPATVGTAKAPTFVELCIQYGRDIANAAKASDATKIPKAANLKDAAWKEIVGNIWKGIDDVMTPDESAKAE